MRSFAAIQTWTSCILTIIACTGCVPGFQNQQFSYRDEVVQHCHELQSRYPILMVYRWHRIFVIFRLPILKVSRWGTVFVFFRLPIWKVDRWGRISMFSQCADGPKFLRLRYILNSGNFSCIRTTVYKICKNPPPPGYESSSLSYKSPLSVSIHSIT